MCILLNFNLTSSLRLNLERERGSNPCFAVVDPNKDKKAKAGRGRFSVSGANGEESKLVPANYVLDGELNNIKLNTSKYTETEKTYNT